MFTDMEKWAEIRRRVLSGEISKRAACAQYERRGGLQSMKCQARPRLQICPVTIDLFLSTAS